MAKRRKTLKFVRFDIDLVWKYFALSNEEIGQAGKGTFRD